MQLYGELSVVLHWLAACRVAGCYHLLSVLMMEC